MRFTKASRSYEFYHKIKLNYTFYRKQTKSTRSQIDNILIIFDIILRVILQSIFRICLIFFNFYFLGFLYILFPVSWVNLYSVTYTLSVFHCQTTDVVFLAALLPLPLLHGRWHSQGGEGRWSRRGENVRRVWPIASGGIDLTMCTLSCSHL